MRIQSNWSKNTNPWDVESDGFFRPSKESKRRTIKGKTQKRIEINVLKPN
jgi:hypothetical protein